MQSSINFDISSEKLCSTLSIHATRGKRQSTKSCCPHCDFVVIIQHGSSKFTVQNGKDPTYAASFECHGGDESPWHVLNDTPGMLSLLNPLKVTTVPQTLSIPASVVRLTGGRS